MLISTRNFRVLICSAHWKIPVCPDPLRKATLAFADDPNPFVVPMLDRINLMLMSWSHLTDFVGYPERTTSNYTLGLNRPLF